MADGDCFKLRNCVRANGPKMLSAAGIRHHRDLPVLANSFLTFDVPYRVTDRTNLLVVFIGNRHIDGFFEFHHEFDNVERICL